MEKFCIKLPKMFDRYRHLVHFATLAPSGHNTQPWKFEIDEKTIVVYPDYSRALPVVDPDNHALFISLGCAVENLAIAAAHYGFRTEIEVEDEPDVRIAISLERDDTVQSAGLFEKIDIRQTTRNKYNGIPIPEPDIELLESAAEQEDVRCLILTDQMLISRVAALAEEATIKQFSNKHFVDELVHWIRFNRLKAESTHDGLYGAASGNPNVPEWFGRMIMGLGVSPEREARKCARLIKSSSAVAVFIGRRDDIKTWINTGCSFERFALTATALGINHAHENMVCEEREIREKLATLLCVENDEQPLLAIRLGYSEKMPYSYRRPVEEVLVKTIEKKAENTSVGESVDTNN